jgi:HSP20 family protein
MRFIPATRKTESSEFPYKAFESFLYDWPYRSLENNQAAWIPAVDILEKDGNLVLEAHLPGVTEKDIDVKLEGHVLTLTGERKLENEENQNNYHRRESSYGAFSRSFTLPDTVDAEKIKADYKNGILTVTIPQRPEVRPRSIPVAIQ